MNNHVSHVTNNNVIHVANNHVSHVTNNRVSHVTNNHVIRVTNNHVTTVTDNHVANVLISVTVSDVDVVISGTATVTVGKAAVAEMMTAPLEIVTDHVVEAGVLATVSVVVGRTVVGRTVVVVGRTVTVVGRTVAVVATVTVTVVATAVENGSMTAIVATAVEIAVGHHHAAVRSPARGILTKTTKKIIIDPTLTKQQQAVQQQQTAALMQQRMLLLQANQSSMVNRQRNRIYIGSISFELQEAEVRSAFEPFGKIMSMDMPLEFPGRSKGFCFIEFEDGDDAERAIETMNGFTLHGRQIKVGRPTALQRTAAPQNILNAGLGGMSTGGMSTGVMSENAQNVQDQVRHAIEMTRSGVQPNAAAANRRVYVGSIAWELQSENIKQVFEAFGQVLSCQLIPNPETGQHKGYGFVEFANEQSARDAVNNMNGFELCGRQLKVGPAKSGTAAPPMPNRPNMQHNQMMAAAPPVPAGLPPPVAMPPALPRAGAAPQHQPMALPPPTGNQKLDRMIGEVAHFGGPSCCLVLFNMVTPEEVDEGLRGEVREECSQYGQVDSVVCHVSDPNASRGDTSAVQIYVLFTQVDSAQRAMAGLDQRMFGGQVVTARLFDEGRYSMRQFLQ
eukprot:839518_1